MSATNVRAGLVTALLAAFQAVKGTQVSDFTSGASTRLWTGEAPIQAAQEPQGRTFMDTERGPGLSAAYLDPDRPADVLRVLGTPTALQWLLKSNFGPYVAPDFTLATQVALDRYLTLAWVENVGGGTQQLVRIRDAWMHRLDLVVEGPNGWLEILAHYAGRGVHTQALNAGGITLPASPMAPSKVPFPAAQVELRRDPAGANVALRWRKIRLTLDQNEGIQPHKWDMGAGAYDVYKRGSCAAELEFESDWSDETWQILSNNRSRIFETYRLKATAEDGRILTCDLHNVVFKIDPPGHDAILYKPFRAVGRARESGSDFVSLSLT
jgi:hypothetical protein